MSTKRERAILIAGDTMGDLVAFWGFKSSMGRIWTLLYLSTEPLSASEIAERTGLSSGAVSMGLSDLLQWGIAEKVAVSGARAKHYTAETDVWGIVRRIVRERELRLVGKSRERFREAIALLESIEDADDHDRFAIERLRGLLGLAEIGYSLVETFARVGMLSLEPIRGALSRRG
ncbi:MAG: ArsR family transcriptional regulator [Myxococcota bacterium]